MSSDILSGINFDRQDFLMRVGPSELARLGASLAYMRHSRAGYLSYRGG
jgi:hypothetical protein